MTQKSFSGEPVGEKIFWGDVEIEMIFWAVSKRIQGKDVMGRKETNLSPKKGGSEIVLGIPLFQLEVFWSGNLGQQGQRQPNLVILFKWMKLPILNIADNESWNLLGKLLL